MTFSWLYQDMLDAPGHFVAEIIDGDLYLRPQPPPQEAIAKSRFSAGLGQALVHRGTMVLTELQISIQERLRPPLRNLAEALIRASVQ